MPSPFSLLVKPASADCNLRCAYCFYLSKSRLYPESKTHRMSDEVLNRLIAGYMSTPQPQHSFAWQGGEPTLMGEEFFRRVVHLQQKHGGPGARVANGLQTNGTLITESMAKHLATYNFLLGVSVDGPPDVHDRYRRTAGGRGSHAEVMRTVDLLTRHKVEFNHLVLVSDVNVGRGREVYRYLKGRGCLHHQYIPCVEFDEAGNPMPYSITGEEWGGFLWAIYDEWIRTDARKVSVRLFDSIIERLVLGQASLCDMRDRCDSYYLVEHNGDVYPCDFFAEPDLRLGNVMENSWEEMQRSAVGVSFGEQKGEWDAECGDCRYIELCAGDCPKNRFIADRNHRTRSWLCDGWRAFYDATMDGFMRLADEVRRERAAAPGQALPRPPKSGRNEPCPCGSGRKFKRCCAGEG